jgi:uncharacterized MAPEG superfamily protein
MRTRITAVLAIVLIAVVAASAAPSYSRTNNVEPMTTVCKLSPAGLRAARALQQSALAGQVTPQQLIAPVCNR